MSRHLSEELLRLFIEGELDEREAVEAALHIDDCPLCASRAAQAEPLATAFAAMPDPALPEGFEQAVLDLLEAPEQLPARIQVPWLGIGLILSAATLMMLGGEPTAMLWKLAAMIRAVSVGAAVVLQHIPSPATILTLAATLAFGCSLTAVRLLGLNRETA
jgi:anti-sigma factor RsiW